MTEKVIIKASQSISGGAPSISLSSGEGSSALSLIGSSLSMTSGSGSESANLTMSNTGISVSKGANSKFEVTDFGTTMSAGGNSTIEITNTGISIANTFSVNSVSGSTQVGNVMTIEANGAISVNGSISMNGGAPISSIFRPVGGVIAGMGDTPVPGTLFCNGQYIAVDTYPDLCAYLGNKYGGNTTHKRVPDLRGYFLRGLDSGAGIDPDVATRTARPDGVSGNNVGTTQSYAIPNITGSVNFSVGRRNVVSAAGAFRTKGSSDHALISAGTGEAANGSIDFDVSRVTKTSTEGRPINIAVHWCMVY